MTEDTKRRSHWDEEIAYLIGRQVQVETLDGMYLSGRLTDVDTIEVQIEGKPVKLPSAVELDKDREKLIDISRLKSIRAE